MTAKIIDGVALSKAVKQQAAAQVHSLKARGVTRLIRNILDNDRRERKHRIHWEFWGAFS